MSGAINDGHARDDDGTARVERFTATSGRVTGWLTIVLAAGIVVAGAASLDDGFPPVVLGVVVLAAVLAWTTMLRPALWVRDDEVLVMRNMLETVELRLAAVEELALRQFLVVRAGDKRWVSSVVGRSWRTSVTGGRGSRGGGASSAPAAVSYPDFVEERLRRLVDDARAAAGVSPGSAEQLALPDAVRRRPAWLPIGMVAVAVLGLVATLIW